MWYFAWILGTAFAVCFGVINAIWHDIRSEETSSGCRNMCHKQE